ncbi:integral membrane TerC family protein [Actinidia rufa]|uniref:Integral membrane TerC family protein n=1 Tax=Actinidia rufa TaxID=165716 RepID=A0A7J0GJW7_9ERIC|nr:integral membrane TerC family protein [Actinidia rufa]
MGCKVGCESKGWAVGAGAGAAGSGAWGLLAGVGWTAQGCATQRRGCAGVGCRGYWNHWIVCLRREPQLLHWTARGLAGGTARQRDNFAGAERGGPGQGWITRLRKGRVVAAQRREEEGCTEAGGWWLLGERSSSQSSGGINKVETSHSTPSNIQKERKSEPENYVSSIRTVALCVCTAVAFGLGLGFKDGVGKASEFFAGYLLEQSLSVDNLFVFVLIFKYFKVPIMYQSRVLSYGIAGAIIFRLSIILLGSATLQRFEAVNLLLALILLYSSFKVQFLL